MEHANNRVLPNRRREANPNQKSPRMHTLISMGEFDGWIFVARLGVFPAYEHATSGPGGMTSN
jgi:hypothetical protein